MYKIKFCYFSPTGRVISKTHVNRLQTFERAEAWLKTLHESVTRSHTGNTVSILKSGSFSIFEPANEEGFRQVVKIFYISLY